MVLIGAGSLAGVVRANKLPHGVESPAVPPGELMHTEMISAKVIISAEGTVVPRGTSMPGVVPVVELTNSEATVKAVARAETSVVDDPTAEGDLMKGASAETAATVVSSLIETNVSGPREEQGPTTAIIDRLGLLRPMPGSPPVAVRYVSVALEHEKIPAKVKFPLASEVTVLVNSGVLAEPSPVVPTV